MESRDAQKVSLAKFNQWLGWAVIFVAGSLLAVTMIQPPG